MEFASALLPKVKKVTHLRRNEYDEGEVCRVDIWSLFENDPRKSFRLVHYVGAQESSTAVSCFSSMLRIGSVLLLF